MEPANYKTAKLADVTSEYYFGVGCQSCLRSIRISLVKLCAVLGDDYPMVKVISRLRCRTCGSKQVMVTFLAPLQAVGNLAYLFQKEPKLASLLPAARLVRQSRHGRS